MWVVIPLLCSPAIVIPRVTNRAASAFQLDREDVGASQTLRAALTKVEAANPGFTYDLVMGLVRKADISVNMHESLLRLQGSAGDNDG